jgi:hypothetical protein
MAVYHEMRTEYTVKMAERGGDVDKFRGETARFNGRDNSVLVM